MATYMTFAASNTLSSFLSLVSIKGGGGLPLTGVAVGPFGRTQRFALLAEHTRSSEPRYWHSPQSAPPLAETWELPSLSRLACTPYYMHPRCKIVQCSRTLLCWTYSPTAVTKINPCVTVLPLASTSGTRNTQHHHWLGPDRRVRTPTVGAPGRGHCVTFLFCSHLISRDGEQIQLIPHGCLGSAPIGIRDLVRES